MSFCLFPDIICFVVYSNYNMFIILVFTSPLLTIIIEDIYVGNSGKGDMFWVTKMG